MSVKYPSLFASWTLMGSPMEYSNSSSFRGYLSSFNYGMGDSTFLGPFSIPQLLPGHRHPRQQHSWWVQQHWPSLRNKREILGGLGAGLGVLGQAEFAANEERHSLEKDSLSKIGHIEGMLFQEEGKDGKQHGKTMRT